MDQAVSLQLLTAEARVRFQVCPCKICGGQSVFRQGFFFRVRRVSLVNIIPPVLHTYLQLHVAVTSRAKGEAGDLLKECSFGNRGALDRKVLSLILYFVFKQM
jgi:hypothetical protein